MKFVKNNLCYILGIVSSNMVLTTYTYSNSSDFPNGIIAGQLFGEIELDEGISETLHNVLDVAGDDVNIIFENALSAGEITTLDGIVAAHVPSLNEIFSSEGYVEVSSSLADNRAIRITTTDAAGGIDIDAGSGGIAIDTTNTISLDAGALINITNTAGNIELDSAGLVDINSSSGINIGNDADAVPINIGTGAAARTITVGNATGATSVDVNTGTGGFLVDTASGGAISLDATGAASNFTVASTGDAQDLTIALTGANDASIHLSSTGTGVDAICFTTSAGGIQANSNNRINLMSDLNAGGAITLDTATAGGGITLSSGSFGILMQVAFGGAMNLGNDVNTGDVGVGNGARARTVTVGSTTTTSTTVVQSGTGGLSLTSAGTGDITINSDDTLLLDADGVLELNSSAGAISIGNDADAQNINIGTGAAARTITVGNTTGATAVNINTGTGDFAVNSQDAVIMDAVGVLELNSSGGVISIGNDAVNQNINFGTAGTRVISIGNTTSTTAVNISSGTWGITIGNNANGGEIQIGNVSTAKTCVVGNNTGASRLITRWGTSGNIKTQIAHTALSDAAATLTMTQIRTRILNITPTVDRILTVPTAANAVADYASYQINDYLEFTIINNSSAANEAIITLATNTGVTAIGSLDVHPQTNNANTYFTSGSGTFGVRFTNVTASTEAYTVYRIS